jgi:hypothetical protein
MKILSIGFHPGALDAIRGMINENITSEILPIREDCYHYNMTHERAKMLWDDYKDYYEKYDCIITSDTAPLSRIFLQNGYSGKLIVYVCNRFDYNVEGDEEYYQLLRNATSNPDVVLTGYTPYENVYCNRHGIYLEDIIKPVFNADWRVHYHGDTYYIPDYQNNYAFKLSDRCKGLPVLSGRYAGIEDLARFKAIIHLPYHWNGIANGEALSVQTPYYIPTKRLLLSLIKQKDYWFQNANDLDKWIDICDFYDKRYQCMYYYFDSFEEIHDIEPDYNQIYLLACRVYSENRRKLQAILKRWI